ncbi:MAG: hypothetical protein COB66_00270 [Coxiella sp. (in: Bacteria)]|nr:MAG: hypothetical protein COB66_00270 [Coxiella sp. (in: g-proteobacteria)]
MEKKGAEIDTLIDGVVAKVIGRSSLQLLASPCYFEQYGAPSTLEMLREHHLIFWKQSYQTFMSRQGKCGAYFQNARLTVNNWEAARNAAVAGYGITQLPSAYCQKEIEQGALVPVIYF